MEEHPVTLRLYDLSKGLARQFSQVLLGIELEAIWHTSVEVHGHEIYFQDGIKYTNPGMTHYGNPIRVIDYGCTELPFETLKEFINGLEDTFNSKTYNLMHRNCNHFSDEVLSFLVGQNVPVYVSELPEIVMKNPKYNILMEVLRKSMGNK